MWRRWLVLSLMFVLASSVVFADGPETGVISGVVTDASGSALPGVQVTLEGDRAAQVAVTGDNGKFVFGLVVPGNYKLTAALEGFGSQEQAVNVTAGSRSDFALKLGLATAEQITVTSEAPLVDKYNVTAGAVMQGETAGEIGATVRSFYGALQVLPGVTNDVESMDLSQSRPSINGALWQESNIYVDGVDATFSLQGGTRVFLASSALTEVSMEAGGGGAEYGRNVGSHTNLIVKSGTNKYHGDFMGVYANNAWNENYDPQSALAGDQRFLNTFIDQGLSPEAAREEVINWVVYQPGEREGDEVNIEASFGGPIKRDKAWFFLSRGEVSTDQLDKTLDGQIFNVSSELFSTLAKINLQPWTSHNFAYTYIDAPIDRIFLLPPMGDRYNATFYQPRGGVNSLSWNWSVTTSLFLESKLASQISDENTSRPFPPEVKFQDPLRPLTPALGEHSPNNNDASYVQRFDNTWHNGWIFPNGYGKNEFPRTQFNLAMTQFAGGSHELKYGLDMQEVGWDQNVERPDIYSGHDLRLGTQFGYANNCVGDAVDAALGGVDGRCFLVDYNGHGLAKGSADSDGRNYGAYVRDRIAIGDHWTITPGLRFEQVTMENDRGRKVIDAGVLSPRLSVVYDINEDGRHYNQPQQLLVNSRLQEDWTGASNAFDLLMHVDAIAGVRSFPDAVACQILAGLALPIVFDRGAYCFSLGSVRPGQMWQMHDEGLIDVDIEPYYRDEIVLGYEWQFSSNWAVDVKGIWWRVDNLIGATIQRDPNFRLFELTENLEDYPTILRQLNFVENFVQFRGPLLGMTAEQARAHAESLLDSFKEDHRRYQGIQLQLNRRFSKGWALYNNVTFSNVEGRTYGTNGGNDTGAFDNLNDDYGTSLENVLTDSVLVGWRSIPDFCGQQGLPDSCIDDLVQFIGQPFSTINRQGEMPIDRPVIVKSYGYKQWGWGKQTFNLGALFVWQSGSPYQRTTTATVPAVSTLDNARNNQGNELFLIPRGSIENKDFYFMNLTGAYSFPIRGPVTGQVRLEMTNITNEQVQVATADRTGAPLRSRRSFQQPRKYRLVGAVRF